MHISLIQKDITKGRKKDCINCALALAVKRTFEKKYPDTKFIISVGYTRVRVITEKIEVSYYNLNQAGTIFVNNYDKFSIAYYISHTLPTNIELKLTGSQSASKTTFEKALQKVIN